MPNPENARALSGLDRASKPRDDLSVSGSLAALRALDPELLDLVETTTRKILDGEPIDPAELVRQHPDWAEMIEGLLPTMKSLVELAEPSTDLPADDRDAHGRLVFGNYRILREVGRGGMGIVYEAEQVPLKRRVALKVLPQGLAMDPRALGRFQLEAQVAGWLRHSRIVPVYDVGLVRGVPYYAMLFIEGGSLADLIGELRARLGGRDEGVESRSSEEVSTIVTGLLSGRLDPSRRESDASDPVDPRAPGLDGTESSVRSRSYPRAVAALGLQAAEALAYAHDQGVVHRDIKPANLLVDRRGELWVADFGMADVQGDAGLTVSGDLPGTLRYMSPEQARGQRALVDRRTDLYSLGATLYELLTLSPAVAGNDWQEIFRQIAEEEPVPVRKLNSAVPCDLATIVSKAMAKDPSNRYETARHLAEDLGRFLDGQTIMARPVGPLVRSWRWCHRKPLQAGLAAALAVSVIVGFAGVTWSWREAVRQRQLLAVAEREARGQAARADAINRFLIEGLIDRAEPASNPAANPVTLSEVLDRAAAKVGTSFAGQPAIEAAIRLAIGRAYHGLGDYYKSESHYRAALGLLQTLKDAEPAGRLEAASERGHLLSHLGRYDDAEPLLARTLPDARSALGPAHPISLRSAEYLAGVLRARGRLPDAEALYRAYLNDAYQAPQPDQDIIFSALFNLGDIFLQQGKLLQAESLYRDLAGEQRRKKGPEHPDTLVTLNNLAAALEKQKKYAEAEPIFRACVAADRKILGENHPDTVTALYNLGHVLVRQGRLAEAEPILRQTAQARKRSFGAEHPSTLYFTSSHADVLRAQGRLDEAEALLRPCLDAQRRVLGPDHKETRLSASRLDTLLADRARQVNRTPPNRNGVVAP